MRVVPGIRFGCRRTGGQGISVPKSAGSALIAVEPGGQASRTAEQQNRGEQNEYEHVQRQWAAARALHRHRPCRCRHLAPSGAHRSGPQGMAPSGHICRHHCRSDPAAAAHGRSGFDRHDRDRTHRDLENRRCTQRVQQSDGLVDIRCVPFCKGFRQNGTRKADRLPVHSGLRAQDVGTGIRPGRQRPGAVARNSFRHGTFGRRSFPHHAIAGFGLRVRTRPPRPPR